MLPVSQCRQNQDASSQFRNCCRAAAARWVLCSSRVGVLSYWHGEHDDDCNTREGKRYCFQEIRAANGIHTVHRQE